MKIKYRLSEHLGEQVPSSPELGIKDTELHIKDS